MHFLKHLIPALVIFTAGSLLADRAPNVIIIYTDDHGWPDIGTVGIYKDLKTPHIDALAASGIRATNGYSSAPQCIPSRAGLLIGKYQNRFGVESNGQSLDGFNAESTVAEHLKKAGYATAQIGKWHLGKPQEIDQHGFDCFYNKNRNGKCYSNFNRSGEKITTQLLPHTSYHIDDCSDMAVKFIQAHQKKPFFLYLAYRAPHVPLDAPKKYLSRFPGKMPERRRQALAMISAMDDGVGSITAELKKLNLTKDTLIFFIGDNGAPLKIHKRDTPGGGPGWDGSLNKPMNGEKGMLTEGGIRVPFVVSWPGTLPEGKTYDHPIIALDATATALDLAGIEDTQLDGTNLIPYLSKNTSPQRTLKWRWVSQAAIRDQNWKLLVGGDRSYLFNLKDDPGELKNLLDQQPEIAKRLRKELTAWSSELKPAGLKTDGMTKTWSNYYDFYLDKKPAVPLRKKFIPQDPLQIRNATARKEKTNLKITPGKQRPFAVITNLNLQGAVTATIKIRSVTKGEVGIAWRKDNQKKFPAAQFVEQKIEGKPNWQTITLRAPENLTKGKIVHLRILLPQSEITLGEITLQDSKNTKNWHPGNTQQQR